MRTIWMLILLAHSSNRVEAQPSSRPIGNGSLKINVVDAVSNQRIAGAQARLISSDGWPHLIGDWKTDESGVCTLQFSSSETDELKFWILAEGYVPTESSLSPRFDGTLPDSCTVRLEPGMAVGGVVLNESGAAIAGAQVFVEYRDIPKNGVSAAVSETRNHFHYEKTDVQGRWACRHVPRQLSRVRFRLLKQDYAGLVAVPEPGASRNHDDASASFDDLLSSRAVFIMKRALIVAGSVRDSTGRPVEGAEVSGGDYPVWTTADGRFNLPGPAGPLTLSVFARGFALQRRQLLASNEMSEARIILEPGHKLRVRVEDAKGRPIPGARIALESRQDEYTSRGQWKTDAAGKVLWDSAPAGESRYRISRRGFETIASLSLFPDGQK